MIIGLPKPIIYTIWMMSTFDRAELMPHDYDETMCDQFRNKRFYVSMAMLHVSSHGGKKFLLTILVCWNDCRTEMDDFS